MLHRLTLSTFLIAALVTPTFADVDIVVDNFESYSDTAAMQSQWMWTPSTTFGTPGPTDTSFLFDATTEGQPYPTSGPGALDGKAALFNGSIGQGAYGVNRWATPFSVAPSETQNVVLSVDIGYDDVLNNKKMSVGLRYTDASVSPIVSQNIIELGFWNGFPFPPVLQFAHRSINFASGHDNWQPFGLDDSYNELLEMDHSDNPDVNGLGFHRFTATVSLTDVTFELDLFNDGINNFTGEPGSDARDIVPAIVTENGFNDLRFGIPSGDGSGGSSSNPLMAIDNISLRLVDVVAPPGDNSDFNGDGVVDGRDFLVWQRGFGIDDGTAQLADGDANGDRVVDGLDLAAWQNQYGQSNLPAMIAIPEPSSVLLLVAAVGGLLVCRRK